MKKNQVDYQTYLKISADCAAAEKRRKWRDEKEELDQAFEACKKTLSKAWETVNEFTDKYGTPPRRESS